LRLIPIPAPQIVPAASATAVVPVPHSAVESRQAVLPFISL
jgi:hypothetical protein